MITRKKGGMTEFIPSPREKREGLIRDHTFELVGLLHDRLSMIEQMLGISPDSTGRCRELLDRIRDEEYRSLHLNRQLAEQGIEHNRPPG